MHTINIDYCMHAILSRSSFTSLKLGESALLLIDDDFLDNCRFLHPSACSWVDAMLCIFAAFSTAHRHAGCADSSA